MVIGGSNRLPKSCIKILRVLNSSNSNGLGGLSQQQLITETGLSERAVKYAVKELKRLKLVSEISVISDMRRRLYLIGGVFYADK